MTTEEIEELRAKGWSYQKIADQLGVSRQAVHHRLKRDPKVHAAKERQRVQSAKSKAN